MNTPQQDPYLKMPPINGNGHVVKTNGGDHFARRVLWFFLAICWIALVIASVIYGAKLFARAVPLLALITLILLVFTTILASKGKEK